MSEISTKAKSKTLNKYQFGELIGKGAIGKVYKAIDMETATTVAIKQIDLHNVSGDFLSGIEREINLLKKLDHPNIVKYIDFFQTKTDINIILEYVEGGSLQNLVKQNGPLGEYLVYVFVKQILEGLDFLHSQGIIHRDIKGGNLLYTKNGVIKLADFGFSTNLSEKDKTNSMVGTCFWMAPEVIEQKGNTSSACDIWSLGSTIIQLLTTEPPYHEFNVFAAMFRIVMDEHPPLPDNISDNLKDFLKKCFVKDPHLRPKSKDLLHHPWITTPNKKLVKKFINESDSNTKIPAALMNEWKKDYKDNLSSITSSQNERPVKEEDENHSDKFEEIKEGNSNKLFKKDEHKRDYHSSNFSNYSNDRYGNQIDSRQTTPQNRNYLKHVPKDTIYEVPSEHNIQVTNKNSVNSIREDKFLRLVENKQNLMNNIPSKSGSTFIPNLNLSLRNINKLKKSLETEGNLINQMTKSLSFRDDNDGQRDSTLSDESHIENENLDLMTEELKKIRTQNINLFLEDKEIIQLTKDNFPSFKILKSKHLKREINSTELREIIERLNNFTAQKSNDESILFLTLLQLVRMANELQNVRALTDYLFKNILLVNFLNILNNPGMNEKNLFIFLHLVNKLCETSPELIEDLVNYQLLFYLARMMTIFSQVTIKTEILYFTMRIMNLHHGLLKLFTASGGFFLLPCLLDSSLVKFDANVLMMSVILFKKLIEFSGNKKEDWMLIFANNKVLTRLNIILLEIFSDEAHLENEKVGELLDKILSLITKFADTKRHEVLCNDQILKTLVNLCYNMPIIYISKLLKIFKLLSNEPTTINKLENIGYLDCLIKLLRGYALIETENEIDRNFFQKITKAILNGIKNMTKFNLGRCESLAIAEIIPLLVSLSTTNLYNHLLIPIFSDLISSTKFVRDSLKKVNALESILTFINNKAYQDYFLDMVKNLLVWLQNDKAYVSLFLLEASHFSTLFLDIHSTLSKDLTEYLSILINFFELSEALEKKFFNDEQLVRAAWLSIIQSDFLRSNDILLINKVLDFFEKLANHRSKDFLKSIDFIQVLESTKKLTKEGKLIIVTEKVKKIYTKLAL